MHTKPHNPHLCIGPQGLLVAAHGTVKFHSRLDATIANMAPNSGTSDLRPLRDPAARVARQEPARESRTTAGYQALGAQTQLPPNQWAQRGAPHAAEDALRFEGEAAHQAPCKFGRQLNCL